MMKEELVSIITPCYNAEKYIKDTYNSIINQTYKNWEWIIVDDMSNDKSCDIIKMFNDERIKLFEPKEKIGPANARNFAVNRAKGRYIAYLDADDLWLPKKLEKQIRFIKEKECAFSFTGYEFANKKGLPNGKKVYVPFEMQYKDALKNTTIWTTTVMFDLDKIEKSDIMMPNIKSEDTALWWSVIKKGYNAYGYNDILANYRRTSNSLSANKIEAIRRIWFLYRNIAELSIIKSLYYFIYYLINNMKRRL